jgi:hypothetical protein
MLHGIENIKTQYISFNYEHPFFGKTFKTPFAVNLCTRKLPEYLNFKLSTPCTYLLKQQLLPPTRTQY